jgi:hypothetical protein
MLAQYLQNNAGATQGHVEVFSQDPFHIAAEWGSIKALGLLFKHYNDHSTATGMIEEMDL